jgi:hypothetical protein
MKKSLKKPRLCGLYYYETAYSLELARGASHISSMLSAVTIEGAVQQVLQEFVATHGTVALDAFCRLLAERLDKRACAVGAAKARGFDTACLTRELVALGRVARTGSAIA